MPDGATLVAEYANVPVYSVTAGWVGSGIVGGEVVSEEHNASELVKLAVQVANGTRPEDIAPVELAGVKMFDWRQLKRWGIPEDNLPSGSVLLFREAGFWELYRWRIIGVYQPPHG